MFNWKGRGHNFILRLLKHGVGKSVYFKEATCRSNDEYFDWAEVVFSLQKGDVHSVRLFWELRILSSLGSTMV